MDSQFLIMRLDSGNLGDMKNALKTFSETYATSFTFPNLNKDTLEKIYSVLFNIISNTSYSECHLGCLTCLKLLFRDSKYLDELITQDRFNLLVQAAQLHNTQPTVCYSQLSDAEFELMIEAEKSLCNLIYNSKQAVQMCDYSRSNILQSIIYRLRTYSDPHLPHQVKLFDMKLLFLITAFCQQIRLHVKEEHLIEILDVILKQAASENKNVHPHVVLSEDQIQLLAEVLKTLFNLLCKSSMSHVMEEDDPLSHRLVGFLRELLLVEGEAGTKIRLLHTHVINLLTAVPVNSLEQLGNNGSHNSDVSPIIVSYLHHELSDLKSSNAETVDHVRPVLHVLTQASKHHKNLRRSIRHQVLPARKDFSSRPEEGDSLLSHLTRCLSSGNTILRNCCAELLFVLCKENPARLVKYTGYGNAAGMLAARGLLACQKSGQHSSSSEESETEEYIRVKDDINPITGVYEPPKPDPTQHMSDERKEYEAVQLVNMIDRLSKMGVVQPCKIGPDGKPQPVEHILELQDQ